MLGCLCRLGIALQAEDSHLRAWSNYVYGKLFEDYGPVSTALCHMLMTKFAHIVYIFNPTLNRDSDCSMKYLMPNPYYCVLPFSFETQYAGSGKSECLSFSVHVVVFLMLRIHNTDSSGR